MTALFKQKKHDEINTIKYYLNAKLFEIHFCNELSNSSVL